jgi:uroporphyrinogen-III decarboxylase
MTDEQLIEMSMNVDNYMSTLLTQYDLTPLTLTAVLVARAMVLNKQVGSSEDFLKLIDSISQNPPMDSMERNEKVH